MFSTRIDLTGQRFGRLTVIEAGHRDPKERRLYWRCLCDCGNEHVTRGAQLRRGETRSCGCLRVDMGKAKTLTHGMSRRKTRRKVYGVWATMRRRCDNPGQQSYRLYGGRGIKVCERWHTFENFYADMGDPPAGCSIDRIDPDGDYEPGNCRWATAKEQRANQRPRDATHKTLFAGASPK